MRSLLLLLLPACGIAADPPITALTFAPDGRVVIGSQAGVRVLSWPEMKPQRNINTHQAHVNDLAFSPQGDVLALAGGAPAEEGAVELFRWPGGDLIHRLKGHRDLVQSMAWSMDAKRIATAGADGICLVHEVSSGRTVTKFDGHTGRVLAVAFLPGDKLVLSAGTDQSLRLWDAATGKAIRAMENHTAAVQALAARPGLPAEALPIFASAGTDRTIRLCQPTLGRMMKFKRLPTVPLCLCWSPDGKQLLAGCADGRVVTIDPDSLDTLAEIKVIEGPVHCLAVKGNARIAAGEKGQIKRVDGP